MTRNYRVDDQQDQVPVTTANVYPSCVAILITFIGLTAIIGGTTQASETLNSIYLEKRIPALNQQRCYAITVTPTRFGAWARGREWGAGSARRARCGRWSSRRKGRPGRRASSGTDGRRDAATASWASNAARAELYSTRSRLFDRPETSQIAVQVSNHYGDEVLKVFDVEE